MRCYLHEVADPLDPAKSLFIIQPQNQDVLISPDYLVGATPVVDTEEIQEAPSASRKRSRDDLPPFEAEWTGVFPAMDENENEYYYMRGLLQKDWNDPIPYLAMGECVRYNSEGVASADLLILRRFKKGNFKYLRPQGKADKDKCRHLARQAEENYAKQLREELLIRHSRPTSAEADNLRPSQPVFVIGTGEAVVLRPKDETGLIRVQCIATKKIEMKRYSEVKLIGHIPEPVDRDEFCRSQLFDLPRGNASYCERPDFLLEEWRRVNPKSDELESDFERLAGLRERKRALASDTPVSGGSYPMTAVMMKQLLKRASKMLKLLQKDRKKPIYKTMLDDDAIKARLCEIKNLLPCPNMLLLCGGIGPEVTAYKRLGAAPLGIVVIQDTDLEAVGVLVAAHPAIHFVIVHGAPDSKYPVGDVRILLDQNIVRELEIKVGGIHNASITNPCQSFSLAGLKESFNSEDGQLFHDCVAAVWALEESSDMPIYLAENVPSTHETNDRFDALLPHRSAAYFYACGSMCSPSTRRRRFATNRPPTSGEHHGEPGGPPSLNGDRPEVSASSVIRDETKRFVHPLLQKFPCLTHNGPKCQLIWQQNDEYHDPVATLMTPEEAERAMGYNDDEVGVTAYSAEKVVRQRIEEHDFEEDGCVISLKDCAKDRSLLTPVPANRRLELLGNSQVVPLLEALMWNDRRLFPAASD